MTTDATARAEYLEAEVMTASPQKLQLMLIEGAIRFIEKTKQHWEAEQYDWGIESLIRAQEIVTEILGSLRHDVDRPLVRKVAGIYVFVFRNLVDASLDHSREKLDEALRVLHEERETWRQLCEKLGGAAVSPETSQTNSPAESPPVGPNTSLDVPGPHTGFSVEA